MDVRNVAVSAIWTETNFHLLQDPVPATAPFSFLGTRWDYETAFLSLKQTGKIGKTGLGLPWPQPAGQRFWTRYLKNPPGDANGTEAWKGLVPFRSKVACDVEAAWLPGRVWAESFHYPHGTALVVHASLRPDLPLADTVVLLHQFRRTGTFSVTLPGAAAATLSLNQLADHLLPVVRKQTYGPGVPAGHVAVVPFTVVTFLNVDGVNPTMVIPPNGNVHRALEAVADWHPNWQTNSLPALAPPTRLDSARSDPLDVLYARQRGRGVWFPGHFNKADGRSLSCYHRNLMFASLQVESLSQLIDQTEAQRTSGVPLLGAHEGCEQRAAGILGRLYGRVESTYRTASARAHVDQNGWVPVVNQARARFSKMGGPLK